MHSNVVVLALTMLAIIIPHPASAREADCSTLPLQCCPTIDAASDPEAAQILQSLGIVVPDPDFTLVGLGCSPIAGTSVGIGTW